MKTALLKLATDGKKWVGAVSVFIIASALHLTAAGATPHLDCNQNPPVMVVGETATGAPANPLDSTYFENLNNNVTELLTEAQNRITPANPTTLTPPTGAPLNFYEMPHEIHNPTRQALISYETAEYNKMTEAQKSAFIRECESWGLPCTGTPQAVTNTMSSAQELIRRHFVLLKQAPTQSNTNALIFEEFIGTPGGSGSAKFDVLLNRNPDRTNLIPLPMLTDLSIPDLINLSMYPVAPVGLVHKSTRADGFQFVPIGFADHDINHALTSLRGNWPEKIQPTDVTNLRRCACQVFNPPTPLNPYQQLLRETIWFEALHEQPGSHFSKREAFSTKAMLQLQLGKVRQQLSNPPGFGANILKLLTDSQKASILEENRKATAEDFYRAFNEIAQIDDTKLLGDAKTLNTHVLLFELTRLEAEISNLEDDCQSEEANESPRRKLARIQRLPAFQ